MALHGLLKRGIEAALSLPGARAELAEIAERAGLPAEAGEHLAQSIEAIPGLLVAIDQETRRDDAPAFLRALWPAVIGYLLLDDDLLPTRDGAPLGGVLDDALVVHLAAQALRARLRRVDLRSLDGGAQLLRSVLPPGVAAALSSAVDDAVTRASASAGGPGA